VVALLRDRPGDPHVTHMIVGEGSFEPWGKLNGNWRSGGFFCGHGGGVAGVFWVGRENGRVREKFGRMRRRISISY